MIGMTWRRLAVVLVCGAAVASGQTKWGSVAGVVQDGTTGQPLADAQVTLSTTGADPEDAVARTDGNGRFGFGYVPAGKYLLHASFDGYAPAVLGGDNPGRPPERLELHPGEARTNIVLQLKPVGTISGTVMNASGDPVQGAQVVILQRVYRRGKPAWNRSGFANTDDKGRYRMDGVFPGKYVVEASGGAGELAMRSEASYGDPSPRLANGAQFYPSGTLDTITPVEFAAGQHLEGIDFQLPSEAMVTLRIKINPREGAPREANVMFRQRETAWQMGFGVPVSRDAEMQAQLPEGHYTAVASAQGEGKVWRSVTDVEVTSSMKDLTLDLSPGVDLAGRVDFEGDPRDKPKFRVQLVPGDEPVAMQPAVEVDADGKFVLKAVPPGVWDIGVTPVPRGGYVKSMRLGDYDVLTNEMKITSDTTGPLNIVVSAHGGIVKGTAAGHRAIVLLAPQGKNARVLSFYGVTASDDDGKFEFHSVTPGRYKVYAFESMAPGAWQDPDFLKPYADLGEAFTVAADATVTRENVPVQHGEAQ